MPRARCGRAAAALALAALGCGVEGRAPGDERPNVVLVSVDTLRADALGSYGGPLPTPSFDRLAREGVRAEVAVAPAPETAPSHATLFTAASVVEHGVTRNGLALPPGLPTLARAFRDAGYDTAAFVSSFVLDPRFGWDRGFAHYDAHFPEAGASLPKDRPFAGAFWLKHEFDGFDRRGEVTTAAARAWIAQAREPFFLFVHYFDPHLPYAPPPEYAEATRDLAFDLSGRRTPEVTRSELLELIRLYHAEVLYVDAQLGALLESLHAKGGPELTLLAVTSDHGEGLGQHRRLEHSVNLYEEAVRVPLIFHWPGRLGPEGRLHTPVGVVDVAPTLAALAGVAFTGSGSGRSLAGALLAGAQPVDRPIFGQRRRYDRPESEHRGEKFFVRTFRWKLIRASDDPDELYDLVVDPAEQHNVIRQHQRRAAELGALLDAQRARAAPAPGPLPALDAETRHGLEALGYTE